MRIVKSVIVAGVLSSSVLACGGDKTVAAAEATVAAPEWVTKGSGAFGAEGKRIFYGVGLASNIKNRALLQSTSDNRARAEIAKIFETYSAQLMKDYMASTTAGDGSASSEEQHVEQATKTFSAATLSGVQIVDHWQDPKDGSMFALARLDLAAFTENLGKMKELNAKVRDYVRQNAERVHADLEKEEAKRAPQQ